MGIWERIKRRWWIGVRTTWTDGRDWTYSIEYPWPRRAWIWATDTLRSNKDLLGAISKVLGIIGATIGLLSRCH